MRVYTYHEPVEEMQDQTGLIDLWKRSWEQHGWTPTILGEVHAAAHPEFEKYLEAVSRHPTVNPKNYELACYKRWLAMEQVGGGWMVDYDVINYGFKPVNHDDRLTLHSGNWCPCVSSGNKSAYKSAVVAFQTFEGPWEMYPGTPHTSDQDILKNRPHLFDIQASCLCYCEPGWEKMKLVHYSNGHMANHQPRHLHIPKLRALG